MRKTLFLCLCFCLLFLSRTAATDFGDFSGDNDYGSSSDSGWSSSGSYSDSGSYSSSGGYSGSGGWSGGGWDSGYSSSGGHSSSGDGWSGGTRGDPSVGDSIALGILAILFVPILLALNMAGSSWFTSGRSSPKPKRRSVDPPGAARTNPYTLLSIKGYPSVDPGFTEEGFRKRLSYIYVQLQHAWQAKDLKPVRPYLTDALFQQYDLQLNSYRNTGTTNVMENITVQNVTLSGWKRQGEEDLIVAVLRARLRDYVIEDATGKLVRGSRTAEKIMEYEYTMTRPRGVKTGTAGGMQTVNCPNCGSALSINQSTVCPYCGSTVQAPAANWVISEIKGLSQRTVGK